MLSWFKKKEIKPEFVDVVYSRDKLNGHLSEILDRLRQYKQDECMKDMLQIIQIAKNMSVLDAAYAQSEKEVLFSQAKLKAYTDLQVEVENAINRTTLERTEGHNKIRGAARTVRAVPPLSSV